MPPQLGDPAPNWILKQGNGQRVSFYENADKEMAVIVFWATWCPYCKELLPMLNKMKSTSAFNNVKFYALNVWEDGNPEDYLAKQNLDFTLLMRAESVAKRYGVVGTPAVFVVNSDQKITYIRQKGTSNKDVVIAVRKALNQSLNTITKNAAQQKAIN
ncbi:hypothetical protein GCM10007877_05290 [Marinibactrum halimedae]|uniref:Thioredoxin domain-containing protein n=2 Tax=Marinibactrum halimedae TaxID=1444977 RepID=A0AA37WL31_9GAMM|nr:hypothetical protein GCM10007877_05290 [Marinibactrum halimedae]